MDQQGQSNHMQPSRNKDPGATSITTRLKTSSHKCTEPDDIACTKGVEKHSPGSRHPPRTRHYIGPHRTRHSAGAGYSLRKNVSSDHCNHHY